MRQIPEISIGDWVPYEGSLPYALGGAGDFLAVSVHGVVKPRQLAIVTRKREKLGMICVYLGGVFPDPDDVDTVCALFCDLEAQRVSDHLLSTTIPIVELRSIARVLGLTAADKSWRNLERWKFPKREQALVKRIEAALKPVASPIQAFDIARMRSSHSVH